MTEIKIRFDLTFSRRFISRVLAVAVVLGAVPELESESVTLSTYYPAPSGVYTQMITTGNTYLARDGGNVGVGTTGPGAKLHIVGTSQNTLAVDSPSYPEITLRVNGTIKNYNAVVTSAGGYFGGSVVNDWIFRNDGGASIKFGRGGTADMTIDSGGSVTMANNLTVSGNENVTGNLTVGGVFSAPHLKASGANGVLSAQQGCGAIQQYIYGSSFGGTQALCPGQFVTNVEGLYVHRYNMPPSDSANGSYMCCPCPTGGCYL